MSTQQELTKNLKNPRSWEYRFLKDLIKREINKHHIQEIIADNLDGENENLDKIQAGDVKSALTEYSANKITIFSDLYLRPGEKFTITRENLKHHLKGDSDLSKKSMISSILKKVNDPTEFYGKVNHIKASFINRLLYIYQSQKKRSAMQVHLNNVLNFKYRLKDVEDEVKEFVNEQHKVANNQLKRIESFEPLTLDMVMSDKILRETIAKYEFPQIHVYKSLDEAKKQIMKTVNPSPDETTKFLTQHRQLKGPKYLIKQMQNEIIRKSENGIGEDMHTWDNVSLMISMLPFVKKNPELVRDVLYEDTDALIELIKQSDRVIDFIKTTENKYILILH